MNSGPSTKFSWQGEWPDREGATREDDGGEGLGWDRLVGHEVVFAPELFDLGFCSDTSQGIPQNPVPSPRSHDDLFTDLFRGQMPTNRKTCLEEEKKNKNIQISSKVDSSVAVVLGPRPLDDWEPANDSVDIQSRDLIPSVVFDATLKALLEDIDEDVTKELMESLDVGTEDFFDCLGKDAASDFVPQVSTNPANLANLADEFVSCSFPDSVSSSSQTPSRDDGASSKDASSSTFLSHEDFDVDISNSSHFLSSSDLLADSIITIPESGSVQVPQLFDYHHHPFSTLDLAAFQSIWTPVQIEPPEKPDLLQQVVASTIFAAVTVTEPATVTVTSTEPATVTVTSTEPAQITSTQTAEPASLHSSASVPLSGHMTPVPMASGDMTSGPMTCIERFHPYAQKPVETSPARKRRKGQTTETTTTMPSKKLKKKEQNKTAANRYRMKKRQEAGVVVKEEEVEEERNKKLKRQVEGLEMEIDYLKKLMAEVTAQRRKIKAN